MNDFEKRISEISANIVGRTKLPDANELLDSAKRDADTKGKHIDRINAIKHNLVPALVILIMSIAMISGLVYYLEHGAFRNPNANHEHLPTENNDRMPYFVNIGTLEDLLPKSSNWTVVGANNYVLAYSENYVLQYDTHYYGIENCLCLGFADDQIDCSISSNGQYVIAYSYNLSTDCSYCYVADFDSLNVFPIKNYTDKSAYPQILQNEISFITTQTGNKKPVLNADKYKFNTGLSGETPFITDNSGNNTYLSCLENYFDDKTFVNCSFNGNFMSVFSKQIGQLNDCCFYAIVDLSKDKITEQKRITAMGPYVAQSLGYALAKDYNGTDLLVAFSLNDSSWDTEILNYEFIPVDIVNDRRPDYGYTTDDTPNYLSHTYTDYEYVNSVFADGLACVGKDGKFGYIDQEGKMVIKPQFDYVESFKNGYACVSKNEKYGIINTKGDDIVPFKYDYINSVYGLSGNTVLFSTMLNGESENDADIYGLASLKGVLIEPQFNYVAIEGGVGLIAFRKDDKYGYLDIHGKVAIEPQFFGAGTFTESGLAPVMLSENGLWGYIDTKGKIAIEPQFESADIFSVNDCKLAEVSVKGKSGFINTKGKFVIKPQFDFSEVCDDVIIICKDSMFGIMDFSGKILIEPQFDYIWDFNSDGLACVDAYGKHGIVNKDGTIIAEPKFNQELSFCNGFAIISEGLKYGYINTKGDIVIKPQFDEAFDFSENGFAIVYQDLKYKVIDTTGKVVSELNFKDLDYGGSENGYLTIDNNGKFGCIDDKGNAVLQPVFDKHICFEKTDFGYFATVSSNGYVGVVDSYGNYIIKPDKFENITISDDGYFIVEKGKKKGMTDHTGKMITDTEYEDINGAVFDDVM